jgi:hypothetical protein
MRPIAQTDGHDGPRLIDQFVPGVGAVIDDIAVGVEDAVGEPVLPHELPDVLDRVEFGAFWRQRHEGNVGWDDEFVRQMPTRLVENQRRMRARRDCGGDLGEMQVHRLDVACRQNQAGGLAVPGADRAKYIGGGGALIALCHGTGAALGPAPGDLRLLADAGFVSEPNLYGARVNPLVARDLVQNTGETFLKCSIAPSAWV